VASQREYECVQGYLIYCSMAVLIRANMCRAARVITRSISTLRTIYTVTIYTYISYTLRVAGPMRVALTRPLRIQTRCYAVQIGADVETIAVSQRKLAGLYRGGTTCGDDEYCVNFQNLMLQVMH
jgi:hypothetical protein